MGGRSWDSGSEIKPWRLSGDRQWWVSRAGLEKAPLEQSSPATRVPPQILNQQNNHPCPNKTQLKTERPFILSELAFSQLCSLTSSGPVK